MPLSPQTDAIVRRLIEGQSVQSHDNTLGPLSADAAMLLEVLVGNVEALSLTKGDERAKRVRELFRRRLADNPTISPQLSLPILVPLKPASEWRLAEIRCKSIRGIAPSGEEFTFTFDSKSHLIYGPNGSGKSSLIGAIVWVFSGRPITDAAEPKESVPIYPSSSKSAAVSKIGDWPVVVSLPTGDSVNAAPSCEAEVTLVRPSDGQRLQLRRRHGGPLEASLDKSWVKIDSLEQVGVQPLDLQLSLIAPTVFGRQCIEEADDTRNILGLMLGLDELDCLGDLASQIATNRTKLNTAETKVLEASVLALRTDLAALAMQAPADGDVHSWLSNLSANSEQDFGQIRVVQEQVDKMADGAEEHLATSLGLDTESNQTAGLADRLTVALDVLDKGALHIFSELSRLGPEHLLPGPADTSLRDRVQALETSVQDFAGEARNSIARRFEWWKQTSTPGDNTAFLAQAAEHFNLDETTCPVCDRPIEDVEKKQLLERLKHVDKQLLTELRTFFGDLSTRLGAILPHSVVSSVTQNPSVSLLRDWKKVLQGNLRPPLLSLAEKYSPAIESVAADLGKVNASHRDLLPADCPEVFAKEADRFLSKFAECDNALALLKWSESAFPTMISKLDAVLTGSDSGGTTLREELTVGKDAAGKIMPLRLISRGLAKATKDQITIDLLRQEIAILGKLQGPLNELKALSKYAQAVVRAEFETIREGTITNLSHMYPESPTGLRPGTIRVGSGKDKSVEALLTSGNITVPGQHFANAGLQRAIALGFYFALLDKHQGGLGFIVMDDPILSLDEEHRERWSSKLLRPRLAQIQVVLATHQRQFLRHCARDFDAERVVELNHRDRTRRISWRPGNRLRICESHLENGDHLTAAMNLRKYREDVTISIDSYCPVGFFDPGDLAGSIARYADIQPPNPLAGPAKTKIVTELRSQEVTSVLDPSAHSLTENDVTRPMVADCLVKLRKLEGTVSKELQRLENVRTRAVRGSIIPAAAGAFPELSSSVSWNRFVEFPLVGAAAAKSSIWSVEFSQEQGRVEFQPGAAVLVSGDSLEPVAREGQWVLLAEEGCELQDGDLAALRDRNGNRYLRRVWSDGRDWILQSINAVRPEPSVSISKQNAVIRKVIGVIYHPRQSVRPSGSTVVEWTPHQALPAQDIFTSCRLIAVRGDSLNPLARSGQKVLVSTPLHELSHLDEGELAVIEFKDEIRGAVIKQIFKNKKQWVLISPNSVDQISPLIVTEESIRAAWLVRGVLFESTEASD